MGVFVGRHLERRPSMPYTLEDLRYEVFSIIRTVYAKKLGLDTADAEDNLLTVRLEEIQETTFAEDTQRREDSLNATVSVLEYIVDDVHTMIAALQAALRQESS